MRGHLLDLKNNGVVMGVRMLVLGLLSLLVFQTTSFSQSVHAALDNSFAPHADASLYRIIDTLGDAEEYSSYRDSRERVDSSAKFYNALNNSRTITFLSVFDQALPIADFRGDDTFAFGYGTGLTVQPAYVDPETGATVRDVKSVQMNEKAFDFYRLSAESGPGIDWRSVDYASSKVPVLLGAKYRTLYRVGDRLRSSIYFSRPVELEVAGFLPENSSIYYQGEMNTFLDTSIIAPYPPELHPTSPDTMDFEGIVASAMINGDVAAPKGMPPEEVVNAVDQAAAASGFSDYTFLNVPGYLTQFRYMRQLITENFRLVVTLSVICAACAATINGLLGDWMLRRRATGYRIRWLLGHSPGAVTGQNTVRLVAEYSCLALVLVITVSRLPNFDIGPLQWMLACVAAALVLELAVQMLRLRPILTTPRQEA